MTATWSETKLVPITEAKFTLSDLVRQSADADVFLMQGETAAAVLIGIDNFEAMVDEIHDLKGRLRVYELGGITIDMDKLTEAILGRWSAGQ
jgi:antitoxin StbD